jgi:hypothetical protein
MPNISAVLHIMRQFNPLTAGLVDRLAPVAVAAAMLWLAFVWAVT